MTFWATSDCAGDYVDAQSLNLNPSIESIHIYDFDSTLFRSPEPNPCLYASDLRGRLMSECQWFQCTELLNPPLMDVIPSQEWWHEPTVARAISSIKDPTVLAILLTGRRHTLFSDRVKQLCLTCSFGSLEFPLFCLRQSGFENTMEFKFHVIDTLLKWTGASNILIYEDRMKQARMFEARYASKLNFKLELVVQGSPFAFIDSRAEHNLVQRLIKTYNDHLASLSSVDMSQSMIKKRKLFKPIALEYVVYFTGIFLDPDSRTRLLSHFPCPPGWSVRADHMTVNLGSAQSSTIDALGPLGSQIELVVTGHGIKLDRVEAVRVHHIHHPNTLLSANTTPHITLYLASHLGATAKESNDIVDWTAMDPIHVKGTFEEKWIWGIKSVKGPAQETPAQVSIGSLVLQYHPQLQKACVGRVVQRVNRWMVESRVENKKEESKRIEEYIMGMDVSDLV